MSAHYVLIGVAGARSPWFSNLTRWSTTGLVAAEYIKALSIDEARAVLGSGRRVSALIVSSSTTGLDRELVALATSLDTAVIVVNERSTQRDWDSLGVVATLSGDFGPDELTELLGRHAKRIDPSARRSSQIRVSLEADSSLGSLIAVTGAGGSGVSTISMALAQGLSSESPAGTTALADLTRQSDLAMYHDVGDVIPGFPELVDAHRGDTPDPELIRELLFPIPERSYSLLLGQRRSRDSAAMGPLSTAAAIDGLRRSYDAVVADVDPTVEGEAETGSLDIELFNAAQRHTFNTASVVLIVSTPGMRGLRRMTTLTSLLGRFGVPAERLVPVLNNAPRSAPARSGLTRLVADMNPLDEPVHPVVFIRRTRILEDIHHEAAPIPQSLTQPLARAVLAVVSTHGQRRHRMEHDHRQIVARAAKAQVA